MMASAITLYQPWATAICLGAKRFETRGWSTKHRGLLAIHAAAQQVSIREIAQRGGRDAEVWRAILRVPASQTLEEAFGKLPRGRVIATCQLVDCVETAHVDAVRLKHSNDFGAWRESDVGDFSVGRWAWDLADVRTFALPWLQRGAQGLFQVELPTKNAKEASQS